MVSEDLIELQIDWNKTQSFHEDLRRSVGLFVEICPTKKLEEKEANFAVNELVDDCANFIKQKLEGECDLHLDPEMYLLKKT